MNATYELLHENLTVYAIHKKEERKNKGLQNGLQYTSGLTEGLQNM